LRFDGGNIGDQLPGIATPLYLSGVQGSDPNVVREAIDAVIEALADGKIDPEEMPVSPDTRKDLIRYTPSRPYGNVPYTVDSLAKFLGQTRKNKGKDEATDGFRHMLAARELQAEGWAPESVFTDWSLPGSWPSSYPPV
jgi:hypothetical protein